MSTWEKILAEASHSSNDSGTNNARSAPGASSNSGIGPNQSYVPSGAGSLSGSGSSSSTSPNNTAQSLPGGGDAMRSTFSLPTSQLGEPLRSPTSYPSQYSGLAQYPSGQGGLTQYPTGQGGQSGQSTQMTNMNMNMNMNPNMNMNQSMNTNVQSGMTLIGSVPSPVTSAKEYAPFTPYSSPPGQSAMLAQSPLLANQPGAYMIPGIQPGVFTPQFAAVAQLANGGQLVEFPPLSKKIKLVGWALMQTLVQICKTDTRLPAPGENFMSEKADRAKRFNYALAFMAIKIPDYADSIGDNVTNQYVETRLVRPFLDLLHREFVGLNIARLQLMPTLNSKFAESSGMLGETVYQLHSFTSCIHELFFPPCMKYDNMTLELSSNLAHGALKCLFRKLFANDYDGTLINAVLFTKIAELMEHLGGISAIMYVEEKADQQIFLKVAEIAGLISEAIRKAALHSVTMFAEAFPVMLISNKAYQAHVDMLTIMHKF